MDWEMSDDVGEAHPAVLSGKIVSEVPVEETGVRTGDLDVESFSFESEDEEEGDDDVVLADVSRVPELSSSFDMKILQAAIEGSTEALELVTGKDVVLIAGKTGRSLVLSLRFCYLPSSVLTCCLSTSE